MNSIGRDDEMYEIEYKKDFEKKRAEAKKRETIDPIQKKVDNYNNKDEYTEFATMNYNYPDEFRIGSKNNPWKKYIVLRLGSIKGYLCLGIRTGKGQIKAVIKSYSDTEDIESTRSYSSSIGLSMVGNTRKGRIDILASVEAYTILMQSDTKITYDQVKNEEKLPDILNWNDFNDLKTYSLSIGDNNYYNKVKKILEQKVPKTITKGGKKKNTKRRPLKKKKSKRKRSKKRHTRKVKKTKRARRKSKKNVKTSI